MKSNLKKLLFIIKYLFEVIHKSYSIRLIIWEGGQQNILPLSYEIPAGIHCHLKEQLPVRPGVSETGGVVVFVQHSDMSGASGAARRRTPVLYDNDQLVAGLLLSVQGEAGADLT